MAATSRAKNSPDATFRSSVALRENARPLLCWVSATGSSAAWETESGAAEDEEEAEVKVEAAEAAAVVEVGEGAEAEASQRWSASK